jgi:membrane dipeptidase
MPLRPEDWGFFAQLEQVANSGVDVISLNIGFGPISLEHHLAMIEGLTSWIDANAARFRIVRIAGEIEIARRHGQMAICFDVEGMDLLDNGQIGQIEPLRKAGVGWMLVAYNRRNDAGGGCLDLKDKGLTGYGREVIDEMKRVGMMICCSHTGHKTARDVMEHYAGPVIFSHSNASAVFSHYRNIPDELIRDCAQTGGVVGVNGLGGFLGDGPASISSLVDHIEHIATIAGTDHVGLGLDYVYDRQELIEYLESMPDIFPTESSVTLATTMIGPTQIGRIVDELLDRGATDDDVAKIIGLNWMRVAKEVWPDQ